MSSSKWFGSLIVGAFFLLKTESVEAAPIIPELTKACFESTCGADYLLKHPFETSSGAYTKSYQFIEKELRQPMQHLMGRMIHQAVVTDRIYQKLDNINIEAIEGEAKGLLVALTYLQDLSKLSPALVIDSSDVYSFDREKLKNLPQKLSDIEIDAILTLKPVINLVHKILPKVEQLSYEQLVRVLYPSNSSQNSHQKVAQDIIEFHQRLTKVLPGSDVFMKYDVVLERAAQGMSLSESEMQYLKSKISTRIFMDEVLNSSIMNEFKKIPWDFNHEMSVKYKVYLASVVGKAIKTPNSLRQILRHSVTVCSGDLAYAYAAFPNLQKLDQFKNIINELKSTSQLMMEEKTKSSLLGQFNFEFILPPAQEQVIMQWKNFLQQASRETEKKIKALQGMDASNSQVQASAYLMIMNINSKFFEGVTNFCQQAKPGFLNDAALIIDNSVHLSWTTVAHPEVGTAIVAHEIGHVIHKKWSQAFVKENACLEAKQGNSQYVTEDFADLFSAELLRRHKNKIGNLAIKNIGCGLVSAHGNRSELLFVNENAKDSHSSALYRLFATASVQNNTSPQCSKLLQASKEIRFDSYCKWQQ